MNSPIPCTHDKPTQLEWILVLDQHLTVTDGIAACTACDKHFLLNLVDLLGPSTLYRASLIDADAARRVARSLDQGSCDINRAQHEVAALVSLGTALAQLICVEDGEVEFVMRPSGFEPSPVSWRTLPCDGRWIEAIRRAQRT